MKIQAHADAELSHAQLQELTKILIDKRLPYKRLMLVPWARTGAVE